MPSALLKWSEYHCFPQPCWHDIYPGKTTITEALTIIQVDKTLQVEHVITRGFVWHRVGTPNATGYLEGYHTDPKVFGIYVNEADEDIITLDDVIQLYQEPIAVSFLTSEGPPADGIYFHFDNHVIARAYDFNKRLNRLVGPDTPIIQMLYYAWREIPEDSLWKGFGDYNIQTQT